MVVDKIGKAIRYIIKKDRLEKQISDLKYIKRWLNILIEEKELQLKGLKLKGEK
jgi:hypothetical protein